VVNTVVSLALFNIMLVLLGGSEDRSDGFDPRVFTAVAVAFALTTLLSYALNRRWTFELDVTGGSRAETVKFFAINGIALAVTQIVVTGGDALWGPWSPTELNIAYIGAAALIILPKFAGYRDVVFRRALDTRADAMNSNH
jgi:putative flippase GtrA